MARPLFGPDLDGASGGGAARKTSGANLFPGAFPTPRAKWTQRAAGSHQDGARLGLISS
jgi:hypothetical protein